MSGETRRPVGTPTIPVDWREGLPELDGISLIKAVRAKGRMFPILILTARDDEIDETARLHQLGG